MAYSNGAYGKCIPASDGGFRATLFAKNFVLDINQTNVNAPTLGHLEPREHPDEGRKPLGIDESRYLLDYGHSFSTRDVLIGWPITGDPESQPPEDLVDGRWDDQLKKVVLDHFRVEQLRNHLNREIIKYRKNWVDSVANTEMDFRGVALTEFTAGSLKPIESSVEQCLGGDKWTVDPNQKSNGSMKDQSQESDESTETVSQPNLPNLKREINGLGEFVDKHLWRMKLLFVDEFQLVANQNRADVIEIFDEQRKMIEALISSCENQTNRDSSTIAFTLTLRNLLHLHSVVMAIARMLRSCESIDRRLSARDTGYNVLLG